MTKLLMCPPAYYTVNYEINPWMNIRVKPDKEKALTQWKNYYNLLSKLKIKVHKIKPRPGLPDMVFTANAGLLFNKKFIVSNFRYPQRQGEAKCFSQWFKKRGYEVITLPKNYLFEGEGDALIIGDTLVAGFRFRSDIHSHRYIGDVIGKRVISLELITSNFYHLDTCFCTLNKETSMYYPAAFDRYGKKVLNNLISNLIKINNKDAMNFCCNALVSGKKIVMNNCTGKLKGRLEDIGFKVYCLDFSEFIKAGGSSKCLALYLD